MADPARRLLVGAIDEQHDLYFVVFLELQEVDAAWVRVESVRALLAPHVGALRDAFYDRKLG